MVDSQKLNSRISKSVSEPYLELAFFTRVVCGMILLFHYIFVILIVQEMEPKKKASAQRNALASALRLQRKIVKTVNESMDELNRRRKSLWWSRWIPREE